MLVNKKAHPIRHLVCAIISSLLFFVTGKFESSINKIVKISKPLANSFLYNKSTHVKKLFLSYRKNQFFIFSIGFVAVFYAIKSLHCERDGHYEQALIYSRRSLAWSMATFVIALFLYLTLGLMVFIRTINHY